MFTLTAQDLHGVIILEDEQTEESVVTDIAEETGLLDPNGCGKTLRVGGGGEASQRSITNNTLSSIQEVKRLREDRGRDNLVISLWTRWTESNRVSHNSNGQ